MLKFLQILPSKTKPKVNPNPLTNQSHKLNISLIPSPKYLCTTQIQEQTNPPSKSRKRNTLIKKLFKIANTSVNTVPILDNYVKEGNAVDVEELFSILRRLRTRKRYHQALQLGEWMTERKYLRLSPGNVALKLDLINKVHGVEKAEDYFRSISDELKTYKVYGALLNCFAENRLLEKAENVMQQMREIYYSSELSYCVLLNLYVKLKHESKLDDLVREMERMGLIGKPTYGILLNFYADNTNIESMEKILSKMENNLLITVEWNVYVVVAKGYLKAALPDKSTEMLKKAEKHIPGWKWKIAYPILISMYATLGNENEVQRLWNLLKTLGLNNNVEYYYMIISLVRLNKMDLAEKLLEEWASVNKIFDFRIPNVMINAYARKGLLAKAETVVNDALDGGKEPPASTWDLLATGYCKHNQMEKAVETMRKAIQGDRRSWRLNRDTLVACHKYLEDKGDLQIAGEVGRFLEKIGRKSPNFSTGLLPNATVNYQQTDSKLPSDLSNVS